MPQEALDASLGKDAPASIAELKFNIIDAAKRKFRLKELEPKEQQDILCAIALAFVKAGKLWIEDISKTAENIGDPEYEKFCARMRDLMTDMERNATVRHRPVEHLSQPEIIQSLLEAVPEGLSDEATFEASTDILTKTFRNYLEKTETEPLPPFASRLLEKRSEQNEKISLFGQNVLHSFIGIIKQGDYPQATKALEFRFFGELRHGLKNLQSDLENKFGALPDQIEEIDRNIWHIRGELAQILPALARHPAELGSEIEERLRELHQELTDYYRKINAVPLDTKPVYAVEHIEPYITMRFEQRGTDFIGREEELAALRHFWTRPLFAGGRFPVPVVRAKAVWGFIWSILLHRIGTQVP